jgi:hypothetical protein
MMMVTMVGLMKMNSINIENKQMPIDEKDYELWNDNMRKRLIRILFLKDDMNDDKVKKSDVVNYVNALIWDFYGAYVAFNNFNYLSCICELEGVKENIDGDLVRKKVLDLASFVNQIAKRGEK